MSKSLPPVGDEPRRDSRPEGSVGSGPIGFGANAVPGMRTAPVEHIVRAKTREEMLKNPDNWKQYNELSRNMRIVNRATKGPLAGKAFCHKVNGVMWPEGADSYDEDTWLQPGEFMDVPKDVALHICGNLWDERFPSKLDIIQRYGDYDYRETATGTAVPRMAPMVKTGPPQLPDLAVCELDGRGRNKADYKLMFDLYMKGEKWGTDASLTSTALAAQPQEPFERVKS